MQVLQINTRMAIFLASWSLGSSMLIFRSYVLNCWFGRCTWENAGCLTLTQCEQTGQSESSAIRRHYTCNNFLDKLGIGWPQNTGIFLFSLSHRPQVWSLLEYMHMPLQRQQGNAFDFLQWWFLLSMCNLTTSKPIKRAPFSLPFSFLPTQ
jgi:hypothetical protein